MGALKKNYEAGEQLPLAGTAARPAEHWSPFDPAWGADGGSEEFPLRTALERRVKAPGERLVLRNRELRIEPTNLCNYHCIMCPREPDQHTRPKGVMPMEFYESLLDELVPMGIEQVTLVNYGEPFIDPSLEDKIFSASQRGLTTYVISNASLLHKASKSAFAAEYETLHGERLTKGKAAVMAGLTQLRLSFYGTDPESYERIMRGGHFERVRQNILDLVAYRETLGRRGLVGGQETLLPQLSIFFLDMEETEGQLEEFLRFTEELCDYVEVWKPHNFGSGRQYRQTQAEQPLRSCGRPFDGPLQINWNGIVVPCCFDFNQEIPLGNVARQTVEEVVRGPAYEALRCAHRDGRFEDVPYCRDCDQLRHHPEALVLTTNPKHARRSNEDIVKSPNTMPEFRLGESGDKVTR